MRHKYRKHFEDARQQANKRGISEEMTLKTGPKSEEITSHVKSSRNVPRRVTTWVKALEVEICHSEVSVAEA